jgi:hypothetical protein
MPWQVQAADVIGATTDDGARMLYPYVVIHVPRRAGKSAVTFAAFMHRTMTGPGVQCWYTAQTRDAAAKSFRKDWSPLVTRSAFYRRGDVGLRKANGSEEVSVPALGSALTLFAPGPTALHGSDADAVGVDEAWSFSLEAGSDLESGIQPAQLTRPRRQLVIISAGGTSDSLWLDRWMTLARDGTPGVALIDYGANPDDDLDDPATWARVHPAIGHTVSLDGVAAMRTTLGDEEFYRSVLGVWTTRAGTAPRLDPGDWRDALDVDAAPGGRGVAYGVETSHDGSHTAISAASVLGDGRTVVEVIDHAPGTEWVPGAWRAIRARHRGQLYADSLGPTGPVVDALTRAGLAPTLLTTGQYTTACAAMLDDLTRRVVVAGRDVPGLAHRGQPVLDAAAAIATARALGDRWVWERRGHDVSAMVSATLAAYGARRPRQVPTVAVAAG